MGLRETGWGCMNCIDLAQDMDQRKDFLNKVMNLWVPQNLGKFLSS
jgi:hypothetical protein